MSCEKIDHPNLQPGWGCCQCRVYNGEQRLACKECGHGRCLTLPSPHTDGKTRLQDMPAPIIEVLCAQEVFLRAGFDMKDVYLSTQRGLLSTVLLVDSKPYSIDVAPLWDTEENVRAMVGLAVDLWNASPKEELRRLIKGSISYQNAYQAIYVLYKNGVKIPAYDKWLKERGVKDDCTDPRNLPS